MLPGPWLTSGPLSVSEEREMGPLVQLWVTAPVLPHAQAVLLPPCLLQPQAHRQSRSDPVSTHKVPGALRIDHICHPAPPPLLILENKLDDDTHTVKFALKSVPSSDFWLHAGCKPLSLSWCQSVVLMHKGGPPLCSATP